MVPGTLMETGKLMSDRRRADGQPVPVRSSFGFRLRLLWERQLLLASGRSFRLVMPDDLVDLQSKCRARWDGTGAFEPSPLSTMPFRIFNFEALLMRICQKLLLSCVALLSLVGCDRGPTPDEAIAELTQRELPTAIVTLAPGEFGLADFILKDNQEPALTVRPGELLTVAGTYRVADARAGPPKTVLVKFYQIRGGSDFISGSVNSKKVEDVGNGVYEYRAELRAPQEPGTYLAKVSAANRRVITTGRIEVKPTRPD
jgi:hypothetical protein